MSLFQKRSYTFPRLIVWDTPCEQCGIDPGADKLRMFQERLFLSTTKRVYIIRSYRGRKVLNAYGHNVALCHACLPGYAIPKFKGLFGVDWYEETIFSGFCMETLLGKDLAIEIKKRLVMCLRDDLFSIQTDEMFW